MPPTAYRPTPFDFPLALIQAYDAVSSVNQGAIAPMMFKSGGGATTLPESMAIQSSGPSIFGGGTTLLAQEPDNVNNGGWPSHVQSLGDAGVSQVQKRKAAENSGAGSKSLSKVLPIPSTNSQSLMAETHFNSQTTRGSLPKAREHSKGLHHRVEEISTLDLLLHSNLADMSKGSRLGNSGWSL